MTIPDKFSSHIYHHFINISSRLKLQGYLPLSIWLQFEINNKTTDWLIPFLQQQKQKQKAPYAKNTKYKY